MRMEFSSESLCPDGLGYYKYSSVFRFSFIDNTQFSEYILSVCIFFSFECHRGFSVQKTPREIVRILSETIVIKCYIQACSATLVDYCAISP